MGVGSHEEGRPVRGKGRGGEAPSPPLARPKKEGWSRRGRPRVQRTGRSTLVAGTSLPAPTSGAPPVCPALPQGSGWVLLADRKAPPDARDGCAGANLGPSSGGRAGAGDLPRGRGEDGRPRAPSRGHRPRPPTRRPSAVLTLGRRPRPPASRLKSSVRTGWTAAEGQGADTTSRGPTPLLRLCQGTRFSACKQRVSRRTDGRPLARCVRLRRGGGPRTCAAGSGRRGSLGFWRRGVASTPPGVGRGRFVLGSRARGAEGGGRRDAGTDRQGGRRRPDLKPDAFPDVGAPRVRYLHPRPSQRPTKDHDGFFVQGAGLVGDKTTGGHGSRTPGSPVSRPPTRPGLVRQEGPSNDHSASRRSPPGYYQ